MPKESSCRLCGDGPMHRYKNSNMHGNICADNFRITDTHYGMTGTLNRCKHCGYIQNADLQDVLCYYEQMDDSEYISSSETRSLQEKALLQKLANFAPSGRLLDVGAGSGILVREALKMGYDAEGVEPSKSLQKHAAQLETNVHLGTLPHPDIKGKFDTITVIDVIEHVLEPVALLKEVAKHLKPGGYGIVVTPDVSSLASRILGHKWWHFRIAHVGYFNKKNLTLAVQKAGLTPVSFGRPGWYFPASYLIKRLSVYLPKGIRPKTIPKIDMVIPLNLFDSIYTIFTTK